MVKISFIYNFIYNNIYNNIYIDCQIMPNKLIKNYYVH